VIKEADSSPYVTIESKKSLEAKTKKIKKNDSKDIKRGKKHLAHKTVGYFVFVKSDLFG
jgi:hypothetical protein